MMINKKIGSVILGTILAGNLFIANEVKADTIEKGRSYITSNTEVTTDGNWLTIDQLQGLNKIKALRVLKQLKGTTIRETTDDGKEQSRLDMGLIIEKIDASDNLVIAGLDDDTIQNVNGNANEMIGDVEKLLKGILGEDVNPAFLKAIRAKVEYILDTPYSNHDDFWLYKHKSGSNISYTMKIMYLSEDQGFVTVKPMNITITATKSSTEIFWAEVHKRKLYTCRIESIDIYSF